MKTRLAVLLSFVFVLVAGVRGADAAQINFSSLQTAGVFTPVPPYGNLWNQGSSVSVGGLTFTSSGTNLSVWDAADPSHPLGGLPATSLFEYFAGNTTTITRTGGGVFDLTGIALAKWGIAMPPHLGNFNFDVTFIGTTASLTTVSQTFTVQNPSGQAFLQPFSFSPSFSNLVSVRMQQGVYVDGTAFQFDVLNVNFDATPAAVPEPTTLLLVGGGIAGLMARRRSRER